MHTYILSLSLFSLSLSLSDSDWLAFHVIGGGAGGGGGGGLYPSLIGHLASVDVKQHESKGGLAEGNDESVEAVGARNQQYYALGTNLKYERRGPCLRSRKWQLSFVSKVLNGHDPFSLELLLAGTALLIAFI